MFGLFIAVGSAARALNNEKIRAAWPMDSKDNILSVLPDVKIARFTPRSYTQDPGFIWSKDRKLVLCVDGYVVTKKLGATTGLTRQLQDIAEIFRTEGVMNGLNWIAAGAYTIVAVDLEKHVCFVIADQFGALPTYHSQISGGWMVSTNPLALAYTGLVDMEIDLTACAECIICGYTIGDRFMIRGIKYMHNGTVFNWHSKAIKGQIKMVFDFKSVHLLDKTPSVDEIVDLFIESNRRISAIDSCPALLQSGGFDSRLILASWPNNEHPHCYTYGDPEAHEIALARSIANVRGSNWSHIWQSGDEVADNLDTMFAAGGIIMWPDRYFAGRQIAREGYQGVLDGLAGDALLGGSLFSNDHYFSLLARIARFASFFIDQRISRVGIDRIAEGIYDNILQVKYLQSLREIVSDDFVKVLHSERTNILEDIHHEFNRVQPDDDSLALGWRNFLLTSRVPHMTVQQGVMCRLFVNVYFPFTNDRNFMQLALGMSPRAIAYRRLYIKIYRRCYPRYADLPYTAALIPIKRSVHIHKLSHIFMSKGLSIPYLTGTTNKRQRDPNSWAIWLGESHHMRDYLVTLLRQGGILNEKNYVNTFEAIASGTKAGTGKLFHLASIAKWISLSNRAAL